MSVYPFVVDAIDGDVVQLVLGVIPEQKVKMVLNSSTLHGRHGKNSGS